MNAFVSDGTLEKLFVSFSRDDSDAEIHYVQDSIRKVESDFVKLVFGNEDSILLVCGDAKNMSKDVNETIIECTSKVLGILPVLSNIVFMFLFCFLSSKIIQIPPPPSPIFTNFKSSFAYWNHP